MSANSLLVALLITFSSLAYSAGEGDASHEILSRGKYLIKIAGCNDCHTPGYPEANGVIPESEWLLGSNVGFRGPWGTTYASNLRLSISGLTQEDWLTTARRPLRPPMPSPSLYAMTDEDLIAIYAFIRNLGAAGMPAPSALGPDEKVTTHYIDFVPVLDK